MYVYMCMYIAFLTNVLIDGRNHYVWLFKDNLSLCFPLLPKLRPN